LKILIDECLPTVLLAWLDQYDVKTVQQMGWAGLANGDLLKNAVFDLFLTSDKRIRYQQNLATFDIGLLTLPSNRLRIVRQCLPLLRQAIGRFEAGLAGRYEEIPMP
jgi:hypothetical protein